MNELVEAPQRRQSTYFRLPSVLFKLLVDEFVEVVEHSDESTFNVRVAITVRTAAEALKGSGDVIGIWIAVADRRFVVSLE